LDQFWLDLRHSFRLLARSWTFTAVSVLTLAIGIGANAAVFSVFDAVMLRSLPFPNAKRLVFLESKWMGGGGHRADVVSAHDYLDYRQAAHSFENLAALEGSGAEITGEYILRTSRGPMFVASGGVSYNFFDTLGIRPLLGRLFRPADEDADPSRTVVISQKLWEKRFGSDPRILGKMISLDSIPLEIVGVLPASFQYPPHAEVWVPISFGALRKTPRRYVRAVQPVGLLRPGVTVKAAQAEMDDIARQLARNYADTDRGKGVTVVPFRDALVGNISFGISVLLISTVLVVLIACANVANLQLARVASRGREIAIRGALGAGRRQIARQLMTENLVLATIGGMLGVALAAVCLRTIISLSPIDSDLIRSATIDWRVIGASAITTVIAAVASGLIPIFQAYKTSYVEAIKHGSNAATVRNGARNVLVVIEVTLALVLLVGAGLLIESFLRLRAVQPGFQPAGVRTMLLTFPPPTYAGIHKRIDAEAAILRRVKTVPGVEDAGLVFQLPMDGVTFSGLFSVEGRDAQVQSSADIHFISPDALRVLDVPLLRGRSFTEEDAVHSSHAILVNREFVRQNFPHRDPIGRHVRFAPTSGLRDEEIVGVVGDVQHRSLDGRLYPAVYAPTLSFQWCYLLVRMQSPGLNADAGIRRAVLAASDQPVGEVASLTEIVNKSIASQRYRTVLLGCFSAIALVLACIGIYGVMAYSVSQRTKEIGIRMAIGAQPGDILRMVLRESALLAGIGLAIGTVISLAAARLISSLLFDVSPASPVVYLGTIALLLLVTLLAAWFPARRSMKVIPIRALRQE
jgi:putative ABC transport system permease protein